MERVAQEAGISKVTLYARYANRHELLSAVIASDATSINEALSRRPQDVASMHKGLAEFACTLKKFTRSDHYQQLIMAIGSIPQTNNDLTAVYQNGPQKTQELLASYLKCGDEQRLIQCDNPTESAELFISMIFGMDLVKATYRVPLQAQSDDELQEKMLRVTARFLQLHQPEAVSRGWK
jgi:TetR/AcrR family transcriptional repressor of mexJK operon